MEAQPPSTIKKPIIFIIGSTASGKTKLSLELARQLKEIEIVNADALQLYKGADILTAKATVEERKLVPHHLLDILPLEKLDFERKTYFEVASKLIDELHDQNKIPLVVGGTNYYIESLLYSDYDYTSNQTELPEENKEEINKMHEALAQDFGHKDTMAAEDNEQGSAGVPEDWRGLSAQEKHELLARIDPLIASKVHPNDHKRVENYIKVYVEEDVIPSKKIMKIDSQRKLRYENPLIFWVKDKEKDNLSERIKKRIHEMVNMEGLEEIVRIFEELEVLGPFNFQRGVLQSIGYKEFVDFYTKLKESGEKKGYGKASEFLQTIKGMEDFDKEIKETIEECKRKLIVATEYYAKKQITWIKNRLANHSLLKNRIFLLEFTDVSLFQEEVIDRGVGIMKDYFAGRLVFPDGDDENQQLVLITKYKNWKRFECLDCEATLSGEKEYEAHLKSKRHKKTKERIAKHKRNMEMKQFYEKEREKAIENDGIEEVVEN